MPITLEKSGDQHRFDLRKTTDRGFAGELIINLDWSKGGFFQKLFGNGIDLDLGCFYEMRDGKKSVIDALQFAHGSGGTRHQQTNQGCYDLHPYIWHTGDDPTGGDGENILVNPEGINNIKRMTIYAYIYEGVAKWAETNAVVTVKVPGNEDVIVEMGRQSSPRKFCAIAELVFGGDNSVTVRKLVSFHYAHIDCDKAYGWGMTWRTGKK